MLMSYLSIADRVIIDLHDHCNICIMNKRGFSYNYILLYIRNDTCSRVRCFIQYSFNTKDLT